MSDSAESRDKSQRKSGHIPMEGEPDRDVYLNGQKMEWRDAYEKGTEMRLEHAGGETCVYVGLDGVSAEHWDEPGEAYWYDGEYLEFELVENTGELARFEAEGERDFVVELREVLA